MEALERTFFKLKSVTESLLFLDEDPRGRVLRDADEFLRHLSRETSKCLREGGRVLLVSFKLPFASDEERSRFEEKLAKSFRFYDLIANIAPDVYVVAVISIKPPKESINIYKVVSRIREVMKAADIKVEAFNYSFKVIPYDGVNLEALLKVSLRELQGSFDLPLTLGNLAVNG